MTGKTASSKNKKSHEVQVREIQGIVKALRSTAVAASMDFTQVRRSLKRTEDSNWNFSADERRK